MFRNAEAVKAREREEEQKRKTEEGVWYSRRVDDGCQLHWAIITHGKKYELRLPKGFPTKEKLPDGQQTSVFETPREYEDRVVPWSLKEETNKLRTLNLTKPGKGHTQDYTVCQIGWTTLTGEEVDTEWKASRQALAVDTLGFDDCRNLLKSFARIIKKPEGCALDYDWFAETLETPTHRLSEITPEKAVKSFQYMLQEGRGALIGAGAGAGIMYGAYEAGEYMNSVNGNGANTGVPAASVDGTCAVCLCWDCNCGDCGCGLEWCICLPCSGGAC
ncbi:uncharacterized protein ColSpa_00735 [Colletotrichum spaethianum]|uniref:Uncharacterized protein n=1 Tax=Colletotrichum spaethianum TaxID=700344 RepID=A0AA37L4S6_9PEZI|nr:uncharacterized protein ColSpa_00735 [Colletotrichum spaethianum]GKT40554.1 hypothetical protein ColSpa_00735 [Colletotrichum spaethianum]